MNKLNFKQNDLLRERRKEQYLLEPYFIDNRKFIKKGIYIGINIISIALISGFAFILRSQILENKKLQIKNYSDEYDSLQIKLNTESKELKNVARFNTNLKNSIVNISSSSALLKEISLLIPKKIYLSVLSTQGNNLTLKSIQSGQEYLSYINGFLISLNSSEFINFNQIDLADIKSDETNSGTYVATINTKITNEYKDINQKYLKKLGSFGLSNRIELLINIENIK
ncbi:PilN domain-containing protein [Prochlorococcus marinus]|uniref:PilN domain-containing protein n=1 Tax=Prochlorococcus marinus TaxID=1219 RepID=UPI001ADD0BA9|nr:PilN domain-containing protein [Prochlorococcus marinus]MBO8204247.1 hypothetical protein [Prochlorococcus marinus CUG1415]MBW3043548.1 hypothetical protein [Prochlorococcus marinus str. MU1415]